MVSYIVCIGLFMLLPPPPTTPSISLVDFTLFSCFFSPFLIVRAPKDTTIVLISDSVSSEVIPLKVSFYISLFF